jgi:hypothetical protein
MGFFPSIKREGWLGAGPGLGGRRSGLAAAAGPSRPRAGRRAVGHAQVPAPQLLDIIRAANRRLERAFVFLRVALLAHLLAGVIQLFLRQDACLRCLEDGREPIRVALCALERRVALEEFLEGVAALRRADEHRPAPAIAQRRPHHVEPHGRRHVGEFVEHHAVQVDAAQAIRVVTAVEANPRAADEVDTEFGFMRFGTAGKQRLSVLLQVAPQATSLTWLSNGPMYA